MATATATDREAPTRTDRESSSESTTDEADVVEKTKDGVTEGSGECKMSNAATKRAERLKRLKDLHLRRNEARKLNHKEVVEEDRRKKLPVNWESRKKKAEWEVANEEARKEAEKAGDDFDQLKMLDSQADELEQMDRKRKKKNPDPGFADYAQAQYRQYQRLTKQLQPDLAAYEKQKMELGEDIYPGVNSLSYGGAGHVSKEGIDRMVADLEKQIETRSKYSRRRQFRHDADVDYINERNMKFNKKAARFYDPYTAEIKQNLERGTAI